MTGNVLFLGFALAGAGGFSVPSIVLAIAAFELGAAAGGRITDRTTHRGRALFTVAVVEAVLLAAAALIAVQARVPVSGWTLYAAIGLMATAMGARNAVVRWLAVPDMTTTVLTMTLTGIAADSPAGSGAGTRLGRRLLSVAAMLVGGLIGAMVVLHGSTLALLVPTLALFVPPLVLVAVGVSAGFAARSQAAWARAR